MSGSDSDSGGDSGGGDAGGIEAPPGHLVWRLSMKWRNAVDQALAPLGLTHAQYVVLSSLYGMARAGRPPSQRELADHTGLEALYVSKLARALEQSGLVRRTRDTGDSRVVRLTLTEDGQRTVQPALDRVRSLTDRLLAPLGGRDDPRTASFARDLTTLLDTPLNPLANTPPRTAVNTPPDAPVNTPPDAANASG